MSCPIIWSWDINFGQVITFLGSVALAAIIYKLNKQRKEEILMEAEKREDGDEVLRTRVSDISQVTDSPMQDDPEPNMWSQEEQERSSAIAAYSRNYIMKNCKSDLGVAVDTVWSGGHLRLMVTIGGWTAIPITISNRSNVQNAQFIKNLNTRLNEVINERLKRDS